MKNLLLKSAWQTLAAIAFLLVVWVIAYFSIGNELLVPSLGDSLKGMGELLIDEGFWTGLFRSFLRALFAFGVSLIFALFLAIVSYVLPSFANFIAPVVSAFRSLPVLAVLLILLSFLGAGKAPVAVAFLSLFPMLYTAILSALKGLDKQILEISRVHGAGIATRVFKLCLPLTSPHILRESGAALSFSLKLVVSAEVLANTAKSLGGMMQEAKIYGEIPQLFALVVVTFLWGLLVEWIVSICAIMAERAVQSA